MNLSALKEVKVTFNDDVDLNLGDSEVSKIGTGVCRWCGRAILPASISCTMRECVWCLNLKREIGKDLKASERILRELIKKKRKGEDGGKKG